MGCTQSTVSKPRTGKATDIRRGSESTPSSMNSSLSDSKIVWTSLHSNSAVVVRRTDDDEGRKEVVRKKQKLSSPLSTTSSQPSSALSYSNAGSWKVTSKRKRAKKQDSQTKMHPHGAAYYLSY
eukprot:TRINITY_DN7740_c2_g1_i2.p1 TRINITY_DN7740_c2_g1~~TRINITY_DN7740_c2_g1_i2.p1  ORF type:complete len:142 (+),score=34.07 TRINITY_DN7740_c2_g1_i2:55-426(+)